MFIQASLLLTLIHRMEGKTLTLLSPNQTHSAQHAPIPSLPLLRTHHPPPPQPPPTPSLPLLSTNHRPPPHPPQTMSLLIPHSSPLTSILLSPSSGGPPVIDVVPFNPKILPSPQVLPFLSLVIHTIASFQELQVMSRNGLEKY